MTAVVYGELTKDDRQIVLTVTGDDYELDRAASALRRMTPLFARRKDAPGFLFGPATWAAVTQLGITFSADVVGRWHPLPRLQAWIETQFMRRIEPGDLYYRPSPHLVPRPYQVDAARMIGAMGKGLLFDDPGPQPVTTPVWTPDSWRALGDLQPGDIVYDSDGNPVPVRTVKHHGTQPVYRVTFSDRTFTLATGSHRWHVFTKNDRKRDNGGRVMSTDQLAAAGLIRGTSGAWFYLPQQPVLQAPATGLPLDPYAYGALLGDGSLGGEQLGIACPDNEILLRVAVTAAALGTTWKWNTPDDRCQSLTFHRDGKLRTVLGELGARVRSEGKSVHFTYLRACESARRMLLAGLLDTDGSVSANVKHSASVEFSSASPQLAADVAWLARSLGAVVTESDPQRAGYVKNDVKTWTQDKHRLNMRFPADGPNPFRLPRKANAWQVQALRVQRQNPPRSFQAIEPAGEAEVCCIELDDRSTHVYLTDTALIPTHNTGKTVSAILGLLERQARGHEIFPMVIVAPSWEVCDVWMRHIKTWAGSSAWGGEGGNEGGSDGSCRSGSSEAWPDPGLYGGPERHSLLGSAQIYVTTYATMTLDGADASGPLVKLRAKAVIADECHYVKNEKAQRTQAIQRVAAHADTFVALSGTPITRDSGDVYPVLAAMDPETYPARSRFVKRYLDTHDNGYGEKVEGLSALTEPEFRAALQGQYRRVAKSDVLSQLPPKIHSVRRIEIPPAWRKSYDQMADDMLAELPDGTELPVMSTLAQLTRLGQLASSAADVAVTVELDSCGEEKKHYEVTLREPCWKADALLGIMSERPGQQAAVFANSAQLILIAAEAAVREGYRCGLIVGGQSKKKRQQDIEMFQAGELDLILCTAGAGGLGITLTAASTVVMLQRSWELDKAVQPEDRAHRLDDIVMKHDAIEVIDVVAMNTVEDRVRELMRVKGHQLGHLVQDPRIVRELLGGLK